MPYASCLASCSMGWRLSCHCLSPGTLLDGALLVPPLGFCSPLYLGCFTLHPGIACLGVCVLWDSLSSFPSLLLGRCTLRWPVWPVIGFPLLGVHPSMSIVKLIVIGYHCNCLDGQLNYWAFVHWLIGVTIMY